MNRLNLTVDIVGSFISSALLALKTCGE